jgi:hypothetical protein
VVVSGAIVFLLAFGIFVIQLDEPLHRVTHQIGIYRRAYLYETKYRGTDREGEYLIGKREPITNEDGSMVRIKNIGQMLWWSRPPIGEIQVFDSNGAPSQQQHGTPFYACSKNTRKRMRLFVFLPPVGAKWLTDSDVSWYYQVQMTSLSEEERAVEHEFRNSEFFVLP